MLTPEQLRTFTNDGFIVIPRFISPHQCELLQRAADNWVNAGLEIRKTGEPLFHHTYLPEKDQIVDVEQLHRFGQIEALELAGAPKMRSLVEQLCGPQAIWIYEGLHIHTPNAPVDTPWMQDAIFEEDDVALALAQEMSPGINCVLYIDPVPQGEHEYYFLPESHHQKHDVCVLREQRGWKTEGLRFPCRSNGEPVQQGDLLIYHPMIAHAFQAERQRDAVNSENDWQVRTLKLWYRTPYVAEKVFSPEWIEERKRLTGLAGWADAKLTELAELAELAELSDNRDDLEAQIERRAKLYQKIKDDLLAAYAAKAVYPSANFCLDFKTGDRISAR